MFDVCPRLRIPNPSVFYLCDVFALAVILYNCLPMFLSRFLFQELSYVFHLRAEPIYVFPDVDNFGCHLVHRFRERADIVFNLLLLFGIIIVVCVNLCQLTLKVIDTFDTPWYTAVAADR
jgi:hypothetical protein